MADTGANRRRAIVWLCLAASALLAYGVTLMIVTDDPYGYSDELGHVVPWKAVARAARIWAVLSLPVAIHWLSRALTGAGRPRLREPTRNAEP